MSQPDSRTTPGDAPAPTPTTADAPGGTSTPPVHDRVVELDVAVSVSRQHADPDAAPDSAMTPAAGRAAADADPTDPARATGPDPRPKMIVAIGASAGGLDALKDFFADMPATTGACFIILQHLSPDFDSLLDELLAADLEIPIAPAVDGAPLRADHVIVLPPGKLLRCQDGAVQLTDRSPDDRTNRAIDVCLESLATFGGERVVAAILSGTGRDGVRGCVDVARAGGTVLVQRPSSAEFSTMPEAVIEQGFVDDVDTARSLGRMVRELADHGGPTGTLLGAQGPTRDQYDIVERLSREPNSGVRHFEPALIARRIVQRMILCRCADAEAYRIHVASSASEREALYDAIADGRTAFFRDLPAWEALQRTVLRTLVSQAGAVPVRVWVPGCATGEDAYCVAALLREEMAWVGRAIPAKVFGSDLLEHRIAVAKAGNYRRRDVDGLDVQRIDRMFTDASGPLQIRPDVRSLLIFAPHDVVSAPPYRRLDLVVARNLLSQLAPDARRTAFERITFGLRPGGILMVDRSEVGLVDPAMVEAVDVAHGLFRRRTDVAAVVPGTRDDVSRRSPRGVGAPYRSDTLVGAMLESIVARRPGRALMVVTPERTLLATAGEIDTYVRVSRLVDGSSEDILPAIVKTLRPLVAAAIQQALRTGERRRVAGGSVVRDGAFEPCSIYAGPIELGQADDRLLLVEFELAPVATARPELPATDASGPGASGSAATATTTTAAPEAESANAPSDTDDDDLASDERMSAVRRELVEARTSLAELASELESTRREHVIAEQALRSVGDGLQASNAELSSLNEELLTVNTEHRAKITELEDLNNDVENLLQSADVGTVLLDRRLQVRRFTKSATIAIDLSDADIGQSIANASHRLELEDLVGDLRLVLEHGETYERQVATRSGVDLLMRIHPYRLGSGVLDGLVLTFVDVSDVKRAERQLRELNEQLRDRNREMEAFAHTVSHDLKSPLVTIGCMMGLLRESLDDVAAHVQDASSSEDIDVDALKGEDTGLVDMRRYIEQTERTVSNMRQTIDDLLELSRVGRIRNQVTPVRLEEVVRDVVSSHAPQISSAGMTIHVAPDLPIVSADRRRLGQVMDNLMSNALKYACDAPTPTLWIDAVTRPQEVEIRVRDNGPGVPMEFRDQIFGLFQRLDASKSGTGVGLALVKRIVEAHGGRVSVRGDSEGRGAEFVVVLPQRVADRTDLRDQTNSTTTEG